MESAVIRVLNNFRAMLDGREDSAMLEMARRYLPVQASVEADIQALALEMERRRLAGQLITEQMVWRDARFKKINEQLSQQIKTFNGLALGQVETGQAENITLGIEAANEAISASYADAGAFGPAWNRINLNAVESMIGFAADGSPLSRLLREVYPTALDALTQALVTGMARGMSAAQVARAMIDGTGMGLERALLIARTEMARAYRTGSTKQYRESGVVDGFYRLVKKATACAACLMLDGQRFDTADELTDHPRGKCTAVPSVIGVGKPRWQQGRDWFQDQPPERQIEILGPQRYRMWKNGDIRLENIARMSHNSEWGDSPRLASMAELGGGS